MGRIDWRYAFAALLFIATGNAGAAGVTLFDSGPGTLPGSQGELLFCAELFCNGGPENDWVISAGAGIGAELDTTPTDGGRAGYSNKNPLLLERSSGVNLDFELRINSELHANNKRSGFAVIVITDDLLGIELEFWDDEIWAQEVEFTHAEGTNPSGTTPYDTTSALTSYSLQIRDTEYSLLAGGIPLFSGSLRNYSASGLPYSLSNFLFFGDNTTEAQADVTIGNISLTTFVPLPPSIGLMLAACLGLAVQGHRRLAS